MKFLSGNLDGKWQTSTSKYGTWGSHQIPLLPCILGVVEFIQGMPVAPWFAHSQPSFKPSLQGEGGPSPKPVGSQPALKAEGTLSWGGGEQLVGSHPAAPPHVGTSRFEGTCLFVVYEASMLQGRSLRPVCRSCSFFLSRVVNEILNAKDTVVRGGGDTSI